MSTNEITTTHTVLRVEGFSCPSCVAKITGALEKLPGVGDVTVHFASGRIEADHDEARTSVDDLIAAVGKLGYPATASAF